MAACSQPRPKCTPERIEVAVLSTVLGKRLHLGPELGGAPGVNRHHGAGHVAAALAEVVIDGARYVIDLG